MKVILIGSEAKTLRALRVHAHITSKIRSVDIALYLGLASDRRIRSALSKLKEMGLAENSYKGGWVATKKGHDVEIVQVQYRLSRKRQERDKRRLEAAKAMQAKGRDGVSIAAGHDSYSLAPADIARRAPTSVWALGAACA